MTEPKLPSPWCRNRDEAERERERAHLAAMERREKEAIAAGLSCRPKVRAVGDSGVKP